MLPDPVEPTRHLVAIVVELAAGMEDGEDDLGRRASAGVLVRRDAAAVVDDGDGVVDVQRDVDLIAEARERLVDRVIDDFVDEVMQPGSPSRPDVHGRALADSLQPFEDLDLVRPVVIRACASGTIAAVARGRRHAFASLFRSGGWQLIVLFWFEFRHVFGWDLRRASA